MPQTNKSSLVTNIDLTVLNTSPIDDLCRVIDLYKLTLLVVFHTLIVPSSEQVNNYLSLLENYTLLMLSECATNSFYILL